MRKRDNGPPANFVSFPDFIPEGKEMDYPGMGRGGRCIDYLPESVHCTDGVEVEPDTMTRVEVKRRKMKGDETIVPFDAER